MDGSRPRLEAVEFSESRLHGRKVQRNVLWVGLAFHVRFLAVYQIEGKSFGVGDRDQETTPRSILQLFNRTGSR